MSDRPIIFSAPMIRALLDGRKTQTRRILKPKGAAKEAGYQHLDLNALVGSLWWWDGANERVGASQPFPYAPGDRLWVRETCRAVDHEDGTDAVEYLADAACALIANTKQAADQWLALYHYGAKGPDWINLEGQKVPPIHMPRWASRLTLTITDVRVERLQEISGEDCVAEGACEAAFFPLTDEDADEAREAFLGLWESLHGAGAWGANPWVVALSFDVHKCNIDDLKGATND